jgi:DDE superfamily endonuclease
VALVCDTIGSTRPGSLMARSMATASGSMSNTCWSRRWPKATSPSWTTSAAKGKAIRRAIRAAGARVFFLPPYSPDVNPIEQVFAKLKHLLRKAAERNIEATWKRVGILLDAFSPGECARYLVNSGYASM